MRGIDGGISMPSVPADVTDPIRTCLQRTLQSIAVGPLLPLAKVTGAAAQLHQTGHLCIVQHFRSVKVGRAEILLKKSVAWRSKL